MLTVISLILLIALLLIGVPVPFSFLAATTFLMYINNYDPSFLIPYGYRQMNSPILLAIPLFIMIGGFFERGNIADKLIDLVEIFFGRIKGALGTITVVSSALFGSITGSAAATITTMGAIMSPRMKKSGYSKGNIGALLASSSVLGMLIPPSAIMILYAWIGSQSVLAVFLATIVPGIILVILLSLVNMFLLNNDETINEAVETEENKGITFKEIRKKGVSALPALSIPLLVLGGIYGGIMTTTEAAGVATLYTILLGIFVYRGLTLKEMLKVFIETATMTGVIMVMLYSVMLLSRLYIMEGLPDQILNLLTSVSENPIVIILLINLFLIVIGMIMDDVSAILITTPILLPVVVMIDFSPIHFAAILAINLGMANVTPPAAPLLYLGGQITGAKINEMMMPTIKMILFAWLPTLILTILFPELSLFLPKLILGIE